MMYRTHILVGIFLALLILTFFPITHPYWFVLAVLFGSLFVDIDETQSYIGRRTWPLSWMIKQGFGHRGLFHSLLIATIIAFAWYYFLDITIALGFLLGYAGHLFADGMTKGGVRIFYPFSDYKFKGAITTGGMLEYVFFFLLLGITLWIGWRMLG